MKIQMPIAAALVVALGVPAPAAHVRRLPEGTYSFHHDAARTGWDPRETTLTVANVAGGGFGRLETLATDSVVYAQPLFVPSVSVGGTPRDLVLAVTENDTAYAFDADSGALVWKHSVLGPSQTAQPISSVNGCTQITPSIGISSTPVVDPATNSLYLVAKIADSSNGSPTYHAQLRSIDLATGLENRPATEIGGSVRMSDGSSAVFGAQWQQQRAALLLNRRALYIGFGSSCDEHGSTTFGWMFAYDPRTLTQLAIFNTATDTIASNPYYLDSIWQGTYGPAADENGDIYVATGNGAFDANVAGGRNYGDSVLRLTPGLAVADWFAPFDEVMLSQNDLDVGSAGVMVVPSWLTAPYRLAVAGGKNGNIFLLDRDALGGFTPNGPNRVYQEIPGPTTALFGGPGLYGRTIYYGYKDRPLVAYALSTVPKPQLTATSHTAAAIGDVIPAISSNGQTPGTAIVWAMNKVGHGSTFSLLAYDATDLNHLLFSAPAGVWNAHAGELLTPTIGNGRVFVPGAGNGIAVFGLGASARGRRAVRSK